MHVCKNAGGEREVVGCGLETFGVASWCINRKLGVKRGEVVKDVHELVLQVVPHHRSIGVISKSGIPREVGTNLKLPSALRLASIA